MAQAEALRFDGSDAPDDALVAAALADRTRFAAIYERYRLPVYRYVRARGADEDTAIDVVAGTFERAMVALPTYRPRGGGLGAWLFRIARNAWIDEGRRRARTADLALVADRPDRGGLGRDPDLHVALRRLPAEAQEAVALRYAGGLTAAEIGIVLGKRPAAVPVLERRSPRDLDQVRREAARDGGFGGSSAGRASAHQVRGLCDLPGADATRSTVVALATGDRCRRLVTLDRAHPVERRTVRLVCRRARSIDLRAPIADGSRSTVASPCASMSAANECRSNGAARVAATGAAGGCPSQTLFAAAPKVQSDDLPLWQVPSPAPGDATAPVYLATVPGRGGMTTAVVILVEPIVDGVDLDAIAAQVFGAIDWQPELNPPAWPAGD